MAINAYIGLPGSGKSLHAVGHDIVGALKERRYVVTNIPVNLDALEDFVGHPIKQLITILHEDELGSLPFSNEEHFKLFEAWRSEGNAGNGPLFVVDECHEAFAEVAGLKGEGHPIALWMATHRHKGADVVLLTQAKTGIPPAIRRRCEFIYEYRSMRALGLPNRYARLTFLNRGGHAVDRTYGKYNRAWFGLYKSHGAGVAEKLSRPKNILLNWRMLLVIIGIPVAAFFAIGNGLPSMPGSQVASVATNEAPKMQKAASPGSVITDVTKLGQEPQITSPRIEAVREQITLRRLEQQFAAMQAAPLKEGGELVPAADGSGVRWQDAPVKQRHEYDGVEARITGHMFMGGEHEYWLEFKRDQKTWVGRDDDMVPAGFSIMAVSSCLAYLKGEHGTYRLTCTYGNLIGDRDADELQDKSRVLEVQGNAWTKPVPALEGRLAP